VPDLTDDSGGAAAIPRLAGSAEPDDCLQCRYHFRREPIGYQTTYHEVCLYGGHHRLTAFGKTIKRWHKQGPTKLKPPAWCPERQREV